MATIRAIAIIGFVSTVVGITPPAVGSTYGGPSVVTWNGANNLQDCSPSVRKQIQSVDKTVWQRMNFECRAGLVAQLNAKIVMSSDMPTELRRRLPASSNAADEFLRQNSALFGLGKIEVDTEGHQSFHGVPLKITRDGYDLAPTGVEIETYGSAAFMLRGQFTDTRAWKYRPPRISAEAAKKMAAEFWKSWPWPLEALTVDGPYYLDVRKWQSLNGAPPDTSFFLGWWVAGKSRGAPYFAAVDAETGRVTSFHLRPVQ